MERVLTELTPECEITARMYAQGYEKKEIADLKCRAVSTINNQLQKAFVFSFALSRTKRYEKRKKNESGTNRKNKEVL